MNNQKYSQFRAFKGIFRASLISTLRNPSALIFGFVFPLIFILIFGFIGNGGSKPLIAVYEGNESDSQVYKMIEKADVLDLQTNLSSDEIQTKLENGQIDGALKITTMLVEGCTPNPEQKIFCVETKIEIKTSEASQQNSKVFQSIIENFSNQINLAQLEDNQDIVSLDAVSVSGREYKTIDFILPGQLSFALLSTGIFGTAFVFVNLRQTLVLKRFFATPIRRINIILGEGLSRIIVSSIQSSTLIIFGSLFLGFTLVQGVWTFLQMLVLIFVGLIVFMGVGFIISGVSKDENSVPPLANLFTLPQFLLSGTFFPIDNFPSWLENIAQVLPLTHLNEAMRGIAFEGLSLPDVWIELLILLAWGIVIYILAAKTFKWE